ncbi:hypothetical protein LTR85_004895 [Meristemomyces frigidus]|nr:hypothetical protein LTR85_004895 [Meristemomyces frigidus]
MAKVAVGDLLSPQHAIAVLEYHRQWLVWTYNFIHWPYFIEECQVYWSEGIVKEKAWVALYYAMLCVGLHHMSTDQRIQLGVPTESGLTERLYRQCLSSLSDAQYVGVHSLRSVQAICLLVLCAHDFDGSNNLTVLLSSAIRIAQALGIHRLGPDALTSKSPEDMLQREISKSIWMFLTTQDWFLIPFSSAYSISPRHCTTPLPSNCNGIAGFSGQIEPFDPVRSDQPTHMSFLLAMFKVSEVYRSFFDETITLSESQSKERNLRTLYEQVLKADAELKAIHRSESRTTQPRYDLRDPQMSHWLQRQRYHFTISVAHKRLTVHHAFFLKSLVDNWYNYTKVACIACARTILTELRSISGDGPSQNLWTITAHAVSASVILLLAMLLSEDDGSCDDAVASRQLVCDSLEILRRSTKSSSMTTRGIDLIELLLTKSNAASLTSRALDVKEIAAYLAADKSRSFPAAMTESVGQFDPVDLDEWMHSLGMDVP